jgi:hypothetical protein
MGSWTSSFLDVHEAARDKLRATGSFLSSKGQAHFSELIRMRYTTLSFDNLEELAHVSRCRNVFKLWFLAIADCTMLRFAEHIFFEVYINEGRVG